MFKNRALIFHKIACTALVTPVLAVLAWFLAGQWFGEQPHAAMEGRSYPLVAQSNCRYHSGRCDLRNGDMRLAVAGAAREDGYRVSLTSEIALEAAYLAVSSHADSESNKEHSQETLPEPKPELMQRMDTVGLLWEVNLQRLPTQDRRFYVVVNANGSHWYGDFGAIFLGPTL